MHHFVPGNITGGGKFIFWSKPMCGRFSLHTSATAILDRFNIPSIDFDIPSRRNIAPSQQVAVIRLYGNRTLTMMQWGFIPSWAKEPSIGGKLINARAETLMQKPLFRYSFLKRRCILPADGFYEWAKIGDIKQPYLIQLKDEGVFGFAGLWEEWRDPSGNSIQSCVIITVDANTAIKPIHDRMPAILLPSEESHWLNSETSPDHLQDILRPYPDEMLKAAPIIKIENP
jgi:putative SOS response-associated peptidase YedK